jgi:hypothetical protein
VAALLIAASLTISGVVGSHPDSGHQVLGGAFLGRDSASQEAGAGVQLLRALSGADNPAARALVVFRTYIAVHEVSAAVGGMPVHYLRAGLVGDRPAVLEHCTIQYGSEANSESLQPASFIGTYVAQLLSREIAYYENIRESGNLHPAASEYLRALELLKHSAHEMIRIYAVGVTGSATELMRLLACDRVQTIDPVSPWGPRSVQYAPQRPR